MKFSRQWVQEEFLDLQDIEDRTLEKALRSRGMDLTCRDGIIEFHSERPDLKSILGFAREASAALERPLHYREEAPEGQNLGSIYEHLDVDVPSETCLRYTARMAANCHVAPSPAFLQQRLQMSGITPKNNLLDIAAAVSLELGENVQIYDAAKIPDGSFLIRDSFPGELVPGPSGELLTLPEGSPVYSDQNYLAISPALTAWSQVTEDTSLAVIQCGSFDQAIGEENAPYLGKIPCSLDPMGTLPAVNRACCLLKALSAGDILDGTLDVLNYVPQPLTLIASLTVSQEKALKAEGFLISGQEILVPSYRKDISSSADLPEELLRICPENPEESR